LNAQSLPKFRGRALSAKQPEGLGVRGRLARELVAGHFLGVPHGGSWKSVEKSLPTDPAYGRGWKPSLRDLRCPPKSRCFPEEIVVEKTCGEPDRSTRMIDAVEPGRYRHYKGNEYTVLGVARHSETEETLVVYRQEYGDRGLWVRPLSMFAESVEIGGRSVPRFERIGPG